MSKVKVNSWEKNGCVQVLKEQYKEMLHFVVYDERIQEGLNLVSERMHKKKLSFRRTHLNASDWPLYP